ncbi:efflux RND transporter permease subunit [Armatimonas sp.]|uniref:efflux RND transporter permease subunit n=1 Tax=Armatimonas sp. TaxID=1872638 RepID=UPI00286C5E2A|nr:efflux RND transporter permease subunit [Armatimonas sp.]
MNLARFSVQRPVAVVMRIAALVLLGVVCLTKLPVDLLPKITMPTVVVNTTWPNVAPEEMETQVTRPIEQAVSAAPGIQLVTSNSTTGGSSVRVQFNWGTDIGQAAIDVLQLVQRAKQQLPDDPTLQAPVVYKFDPATLPIRIYGVSGISDIVKLRSLLANEVSPLLASAEGVATATVTGGQTRSIIIEVDPVKLQAYGLSIDLVQRRLVQENINVPAGIARQGDREFTIRSVGYFSSLTDAEKITLAQVNGQPVLLRDVATVEDSHLETRILTRLNGEPAASLAITKQSEANTVATAEAIEKKIEQVNKLYPQLKFQVAYDQSGFIQNSVTDLQHTAIIGGVLAVLILLFFLRNLRSTLVVALSIPVSIFSTFSLLYFCGFTLNTISLSGLALAAGLIVDDAVVVLENIFRHIERDKQSAVEGAVSGASEITSAVVASTITVMVVFLPILLIKGQTGQMFTQFALVVIFSMAVSLLDATTLVPMLASRLIHREELEQEKERPSRGFFGWAGRYLDSLDANYRRRLAWALSRRWWVLAGAAAISLASYLFVPLIGSETLPQTDSGDFTVSVKLPIGTAFLKTSETMREVEKRILANPDVETVFAASGATLSLRGSVRDQAGHIGSATVHLKANRKLPTQQVIKDVQKSLGSIPGIRATVSPYDLVTQLLTGGATNMEIDVFGQDNKSVAVQAKKVMEALKGVPGLEALDLGVQDATPELQWKIDRDKASALGVSFADIANAINSSTGGAQAGYYLEKGYQYPIYVILPEKDRKSLESLANLPISPKSGGKPILLSQVATPFETVGPNEITRLDRQRYIAVNGRLADRSQGDVEADVRRVLEKMEFAPGTYWDFGQNQKRRGTEFAGLGVAVVLAVALIYMLLASQFESFVYPLIVLTSVPLCAVGVVLALFLTGRAFGITAFIGLLMLVGIVVKNGILLVDYTNQLRERGTPRDEAILTASPTRLRPILMTTSAAVLGMLPLALALGQGSETQAPLATAVIGGLITSTVLTLFVVPCVYTLFDDLGQRLRRR